MGSFDLSAHSGQVAPINSLIMAVLSPSNSQ